jgi:hypothetical protein
MLLLHDCGLHRRDGFCYPIILRCLPLGQCDSRRKIWQSSWVLRWMVSVPPTLILNFHPWQHVMQELH